MNEKELKALQDAIKNGQEKQTALIAEIKAGVDGQKGDYDKKFDEYAKNIQKLSEQADAIRLSIAATTELTTFLKTRTPCHAMMDGKFRSIQ